MSIRRVVRTPVYRVHVAERDTYEAIGGEALDRLMGMLHDAGVPLKNLSLEINRWMDHSDLPEGVVRL